MANFLMLARGTSVGTAKLVAISADQTLIERFVRELIAEDTDVDDRDERKPLKVVQADG